MSGTGPAGVCGGEVIVLDPEEEAEPEGAAAGPSPAEQHFAAPTAASPPPPAEGRDLRAENHRLFAEFVAFCSQHTREHPEVMPYLSSRHQKSSPEFLSSVEFRNVLGRCLSRVQSQRSKVYVYINELCTVFKAHSLKKRQQQPQQSFSPSPAEVQDTPSGASQQEPRKPPHSGTSKRQIRYLENLLKIYSEEIQRLQAQELDLDELDNEDSAYLQESRLKRRMMRIFKRLCELKDCNSLTGRVIEQRIPYRGTRYPEVNRCIERLINRPEAFPDYNDILKVVQKASARHNLGLPRQQMASIATNAFQEVGERLQERRRLDLVYNFGSYLTDEYRREDDPALADDGLARRLRHNREVAVKQLDQVLVRYADLQDKGVEGERHLGQAKLGGATGPQQDQPAALKEPESEVVASSGECGSGLKSSHGESSSPDREEEDEEESSSSDTDLEAELEKSFEDGEEEEEEGLAPDPEIRPAQEVEADQHMGMKEPELLLDSSLEEEEEEDDNDDDDCSEEREDQAEVEEKPPPPEPPGDSPTLNSSPSQQFLLEIEAALPLEDSETPPPSPAQLPPSPPLLTQPGDSFPISLAKPQPSLKRSRSLENGGTCQLPPTASCKVNGQPPSKRGRQELSISKSSCIEVLSGGSSEEESEGPMSPLSPDSPIPAVDSTSADSPRGSPQPVQICKASVATQCDPEEIIVLSDSE